MHPLRFVGFRLQSVFAFIVAVALLLTAPGLAAARDLSMASLLERIVDDVELQAPSLLVYHQITAFTEESGGFSFPVLSGDGSRAAFSSFIRSDDPAIYGWNSISILHPDGTGLTEIDYYESPCLCNAKVDISDDGETVVSSDSAQVRVAGAGGARELVVLSYGDIGAVRITADGRTVFFVVAYDTRTNGDGREVAPGIWAVNADGGDLRQIVDAATVAEALGIPVEASQFSVGAQWLDVSDDGGTVAFGAYAYDFFNDEQHYVFAASGNGGKPRLLIGPNRWLDRVAISGDGATVAYDLVPPGAATLDDNEVGVVDADGGEPRALLTRSVGSGDEDRLQLSADGARLLVSQDGLLFDTARGEAWQLAVQTPGTHPDPRLLVADELEAATMNADATRFLYVMHRADWIMPNPRQLATLDLDPVELGDAPFISEPAIDRAELPLDGETAATASAYVEAEGSLIGLGLIALRDGREDDDLYAQLFDGGDGGDAEAGDGIFSAEFRAYGSEEEDRTGPRMLRIEAEIVTVDGLRHATAVEFGPLTLNQAA